MRTRENSTVIALRVETRLREEFEALAAETGSLVPRKLRDAYLHELELMRKAANQKRIANGSALWEDEWTEKHANAT
jgi:hypothetical protein